MSSSFPPCPDDLTVSALISAKGDQLRHWIDGVNKVSKAARQPGIKKKQPVEDLRASLAGHYGLDLSVIPAVVVEGPAPIGEAIRRSQWDHLRTMGAKWTAVAESGGTFNLLASSTSTGVFPFLKLSLFLFDFIFYLQPRPLPIPPILPLSSPTGNSRPLIPWSPTSSCSPQFHHPIPRALVSHPVKPLMHYWVLLKLVTMLPFKSFRSFVQTLLSTARYAMVLFMPLNNL